MTASLRRYTLGAKWIERHFTKDRTWKGTDHAASLEPAGMQKLCRDLKATWKCMTYKQVRPPGLPPPSLPRATPPLPSPCCRRTS